MICRREQLILKKEEIRKPLLQKEGCLSSTRNIDGSAQVVGRLGLASNRTLYSQMSCVYIVCLADCVVFIVRFLVSLAVLENRFKTRL